MASKTYDNDISVVGKVTQTGTASASGDLITKGVHDTDISGRAPTTRLISTTGGITGGGDLSADRTFTIADGALTIAKLIASTSAALGVGTIELGHATDTTLSRSAAGKLAVEGIDVVLLSGAQTLLNKTLTSPVINTPTGIVKGDVGLGNVDNTSNATERAASRTLTNATLGSGCVIPVTIGVALSDETTDLTTGTAKLTMRMPHAMTLTAVRASLATASSSGIVTVDINDGGSTIMTTNKLSIDASEKTSTTAATAAALTDTALADDAEITFDIDAAGTGARGLKVWLIGTRTL